MLSDLRAAPRGSYVVLHASGHNPTGADPAPDEWGDVMAACRARALVPVFDLAYQGLVSGCLERDAAALRRFVRGGLPVAVCQSFSKSMGLYGLRLGAVHVVCASADEAARVRGQLAMLGRGAYSSPPVGAARVAGRVMGDADLAAEWAAEVAAMAGRLDDQRSALLAALDRAGTRRDWGRVAAQRGMFAFTGLGAGHARRLRDEHGVFLLDNGRISLAGVNADNVDRLAAALVAVAG